MLAIDMEHLRPWLPSEAMLADMFTSESWALSLAQTRLSFHDVPMVRPRLFFLPAIYISVEPPIATHSPFHLHLLGNR